MRQQHAQNAVITSVFTKHIVTLQKAAHCYIFKVNITVKIPETLTSLQVPFTSTFPSGQVHLAPVGLSKHMKSQDILEHGLGPVEKQRRRSSVMLNKNNFSFCETCGCSFLIELLKCCRL